MGIQARQIPSGECSANDSSALFVPAMSVRDLLPRFILDSSSIHAAVDGEVRGDRPVPILDGPSLIIQQPLLGRTDEVLE